MQDVPATGKEQKMKQYEEFSSELTKIHDDKIIAEWTGAFDSAMDFMCQAVTKHVETSEELPNINEVELHLLSYVNDDYPDGYDAEANTYAFTTNTLPLLTTEALTARLKTELEKMLHESGWVHLYVTIESYSIGHHVIAHTV